MTCIQKYTPENNNQAYSTQNTNPTRDTFCLSTLCLSMHKKHPAVSP
jgi:hypothetical protein